jgi:peptidoglycan/LPS O-acetylase OafA/YrhL
MEGLSDAYDDQAALDKPSNRIPTLDGWRGLALLLVLMDHLLIGVFAHPLFPSLQLIGQHGVTIFFVLSGFLITTRLSAEMDATSSISLRQFYWRRFFRLMPSAWFYLGALTLLLLSTPHFHKLPIVASILSFRNFVDINTNQVLTAHFWTLSIEEQFYLVWPPLLLLLGRRKALMAALGACVAVAAWRFLHWNQLIAQPLAASFATQYRADSLLTGCVLGLNLPRLRPFLRAWQSIPLIVLLFFFFYRFHRLIPLSESIVIALLLAVTSATPRGYLSLLLEWKPLARLGVLSYSIYIWQQVCFIRWPGRPWVVLPVLLFSIVLLGCASHYLLEKPLIVWARRVGRAPEPVEDRLGCGVT